MVILSHSGLDSSAVIEIARSRLLRHPLSMARGVEGSREVPFTGADRSLYLVALYGDQHE